jgi:hypothetical protein
MRYWLLFLILNYSSSLYSQIEIKTSITNSKDSWFNITINSSSQKVANAYLAISAKKDGLEIFNARTKNIIASPGTTVWNKISLEPIQVTTDRTDEFNSGDRLILDIILIDPMTNGILGRLRENISFTPEMNEKSEEKGPGFLSDKFKMAGTVNLLGQISDRQGIGSTVPQNFLRADGNSTLSFSMLPVDLSFVATSEQSALRQSMNRATARFNIPMLKQNLKSNIEEKMKASGDDADENPTESELEAFKEEMLKTNFPSYKSQKVYFDTPDGKYAFDKLRTYQGLKDLQMSPATSKNIKKYKKLSTSKNLSVYEKSQQKELHLFVIELAQGQKEMQNIKTELGNNFDRLNQESIEYIEAEKYYNSLTIKDYKKSKQSFNPYRLLNKTQKILDMLQGVSIGMTSPYFSKMTLSSLMINGLQIEINPGKFYFSGVIGRSARQTYNTGFSIPDLTLKQNTYGVKAGYGSLSESHLHFSFTQITDNNSPLSEGALINPQANRLIGLHSLINLLDNNLSIEGEYVGSLITRNTESSPLAENLRSNIPLGFLYPKANSSSSYDYGFNIDTKWKIPSLGLDVNGNIEKINPNFISLGAPTLLSNVLRWRANVRKSLFSNKVQLGLNAQRDNNNLVPVLSSVNSTIESFGGNLSIAFPDFPQLSLSYAPFAQKSEIVETGEVQFSDTKVTNVSVSYPYKFGEGVRATTQLSYLNQSLVSNIEGASSQNTTYSLNQSLSYKEFGANVSLSHAPNQQIAEVKNDVNTFALNGTYSKDKLNTSLGVQILQIPVHEMKTGFLASAGYKITDKILCDLRAQRNIYDAIVGANSFNEYIIQSGLRINFGSSKKGGGKTKYTETPKPAKKELSKVDSDTKGNKTTIADAKNNEIKNSEDIIKPASNKKPKEESIDKLKFEKEISTNNKVKESEKSTPANLSNENKKEPTVDSKDIEMKVNVKENVNGEIANNKNNNQERKERNEKVLPNETEIKNLNPSIPEDKKEIPVITNNEKKVISELSNNKAQEKIAITSTSKAHHYKVLFAILDHPDKEFLSLMTLGPVTSEKANGNNYIYYIGHFKDEDKANIVKDQVKAAGFQAARVMEFNKGQLEKESINTDNQPPVTDIVKEIDLQKQDQTKSEPIISKPKEEVKPDIKKQDQIQKVVVKDVVSYHILFRILPDPYQKFDDLKKIGPLYRETYDAKGNSRYLIGNTDDINVAKKLLEKVKKAGYPASFIAEYINGSLSKIIQE